MRKNRYFIGVDVGTGSVRAGVFDEKGVMLGLSSRPIRIWKPREDFVEQSSDDIWLQTTSSVREAVALAKIPPDDVIAIGFDATCSLVALDKDGGPLSVSPTGRNEQNVIVWMDHRAQNEAAEINRTKDKALRYVGGAVSVEMELPKLLWLKRNQPKCYNHTGYFFDLADFLVYKASGRNIRSICTMTCKWTYLGHERRWSKKLFSQIGLEDLFAGSRIGEEIRPLGEAAGILTSGSARKLGLSRNTVVAVGIIDAHAGGIGVIGYRPEGRLALIGGTSSCHMAVSKRPLFVKGVWGPYYGAMLPGLWLSEGGQSATGALIDHIINDAAMGAGLRKEAKKTNRSVYDLLNADLYDIEKEDPYPTGNIHVLPYFHGNRSPRGDASLTGMISGLTLNTTRKALAKTYLATVQAIAYGTCHIIETMNRAGHNITSIHVCGGGSKNPVWLREHADITGCEIVLPKEPEAVILGSAILAATAAKAYPSIFAAMKNMSGVHKRIKPDLGMRSYHQKKYQVFLEMYRHQMKYKKMMGPAPMVAVKK